MPYSELRRDKKGKMNSVAVIPVEQLRPPSSTRLVLTKDLNRWELVQPIPPPSERKVILIMICFGIIVAPLAIFSRTGVARAEVDTFVYVFFGLLGALFLGQMFFQWRRYVTKTTVTIEHGELVVASSLYDRMPYRTKRWDLARGDVEQIESVYRRTEKSGGHISIHGKHNSNYCWKRGYVVFEDTSFFTLGRKGELDWIAREMAHRLDVPAVTASTIDSEDVPALDV